MGCFHQTTSFHPKSPPGQRVGPCSYGFLETFCPGIRNIGFAEFAFYLHLLNFVLYHWVGNLKTAQLPAKVICIFRTSGEGVEETLIVQFGQQWMKSTTDALQDKKEEDNDPSQVEDFSGFICPPSRLPCHVFYICMLTNIKYQKYKPVELGDQLHIPRHIFVSQITPFTSSFLYC